MKKSIIVIIAIIILIAIIVAVVLFNQKSKTKLEPINSAEDLSALMNKVQEGKEDLLWSLQTQTIDINDESMVNATTGLNNGNDLEYLVVSEPMVSAQAYSCVLAKVKSKVNANEIAKSMSEKIDTRKWICVSAEKLYATNSGDVVCLVMSSEELAKPVYDKFKELAGNVGKEYEKTEEEPSFEDFETLPTLP